MRQSDRPLTDAQQRVLWTLAQYKYGWTYLSSPGTISAARALVRRGMVEEGASYKFYVKQAGEDYVIGSLYVQCGADAYRLRAAIRRAFGDANRSGDRGR